MKYDLRKPSKPSCTKSNDDNIQIYKTNNKKNQYHL